MTKIPDLIGLILESAKDKIADHFLNVGAITYDETILDMEDSAAAFVWRQYPEYSAFNRLNMGLEIDVWLTIDSTLLPLPDSILVNDVADTDYE